MFGRDAALVVFDPAKQMRRARVSTDDLREKQLRGSFPAEEAAAASPDAGCRGGVFAQHIPVVSGMKPAFPGLEIIKRMKSCCPGASGGKMDGSSREGGGRRSALPHGKGGGKTFPF